MGWIEFPHVNNKRKGVYYWKGKKII